MSNRVKLPPPKTAAQRVVARRLMEKGALDPKWLPPVGTLPDLDDLTEEVHRVLGELRQAVDAWNSVAVKVREKSAQRTDALKRKVRSGGDAVEPGMLTDDDIEVDAAEEVVWVTADVLADLADAVIERVRLCEDASLADTRAGKVPGVAGLTEAEDDLREAERLVREAHRKMHRLVFVGRWIQGIADGDGFGARQPWPDLADVTASKPQPAVLRDALTRHWSKAQPWSGAYDPQALIAAGLEHRLSPEDRQARTRAMVAERTQDVDSGDGGPSSDGSAWFGDRAGV